MTKITVQQVIDYLKALDPTHAVTLTMDEVVSDEIVCLDMMLDNIREWQAEDSVVHVVYELSKPLSKSYFVSTSPIKNAVGIPEKVAATMRLVQGFDTKAEAIEHAEQLAGEVPDEWETTIIFRNGDAAGQGKTHDGSPILFVVTREGEEEEEEEDEENNDG